MKGKILVIDDEEGIRFTFENFLSDEGYQVVTASNYDKAMSLISERDFDVIFTDIVMEGLTGIDVLREIKKRTPNCPVIMITGAPDAKTASEALRLGAHDYLFKPIKQDTLLHITKKVLEHKKLLDERERYRSNIEAIFRSVKDAIITVDDRLTVIEANESAENICGITRDALGKPLISLNRDCTAKCLDAVRTLLPSSICLRN